MIVSETYSALLTAKFDFAIDNNSGKWSTPQETFKYRSLQFRKANSIEASYPFDVIDTRVKIPGNGKVVVYRYESSPGKDFELIGRITPFTTETEG